MIRVLARVVWVALFVALVVSATAANIVTVARAAEGRPHVVGAFAAVGTLAYLAGRVQPLRRLYDRLDGANDRAFRRWQKGDRVWPLAVRYGALHPVRLARSVARVRRGAREAAR